MAQPRLNGYFSRGQISNLPPIQGRRQVAATVPSGTSFPRKNSRPGVEYEAGNPGTLSELKPR